MKAKEWWRNNSEEWLEKMKKWEKEDKGNSKHFQDEADFLIDEISKSIKSDTKILEVGAGNGRIIGKLSRIGFLNCNSIDINKELSEYVKSHQFSVKTYVGEITNLPFKDKEFDLIYTHEVLQHIEPDEIDKAISELLRVGKEVWCMENWRDKQADGEKVSDSHCGRWNYDLKKRLPTYYDFYTDWGQMFVKAKE